MLRYSRLWTRQPQRFVELDYNFFKQSEIAEVLCPSMGGLGYGLKSKTRFGLTSPNPTMAYGPGGLGTAFTGASTTSSMTLAADANTLVGTTNCTMLLLRSLNGLTFGSTAEQHGYRGDPATVSVHCPYTDNVIYWDFGDTSTGRLASPAQTWAIGAVDAIVLTAGSVKGREIWRNGVRIANDAAKTLARSGAAGAFRLGAAGGTGSANPETIYQFVLLSVELDNARIRQWSANPWRIFRTLDQIFYVNALASDLLMAQALL